MTESQRTRESTQYRAVDSNTEPTGWVGWILFAGTMLLLVGTFQIMAGFVALFNKSYYVTRSSDLAITFNYTSWGWIQIVVGVLALAAGYGVMVGKLWARIYAIAYAGLAAIANMAFLGAYPIWITIMITVDILVIWALAVHGREMTATS